MNSIQMGYDSDDEKHDKDCLFQIQPQNSLRGDSCSKNCSTCNTGISLEITEQRESPFSFKKTVVLVVAVEKLKRGTKKGNAFLDTDLLDFLKNIFVEEEISFNNSEFAFATESSYRYFTSEDYKIKDSSSKCLVLQEFHGNAKLVALQLQGINSKREEKIKMAYYSTQTLSGAKKQPVALGLMGRNLYLSCTTAGDTPELCLEEVSNIRGIKTSDLQRFIFLKSDNSLNGPVSCRFESACYPSWYISTSQSENEMVQMAHQEDQRCINEFRLFK